MQSKSEQIRNALDSGNAAKALSLASKFFDRSERTQLYKQAQSAANNPSFYRQIGKDPNAIVDLALADLRSRFL